MRDARLSDLDPTALDALAADLSLPLFKKKQIAAWLWQRGVFDPREMTDLSRDLRERLATQFPTQAMTLAEENRSADGTTKLLFRLSDGKLVEAVLIPTNKRLTVCLSSQVGCAVGCRFCASGLEGLKRNLTRGEIFEQFILSRHAAEASERVITNIVMMGMGEPMHNYENVFGALERINASDGLNFGARRITVSTSGIAAGVERFTNAKTQYTLAFSLHAPTDEIRRDILPLKNAMTVSEIASAAKRYLEVTGREVTFEYVLLAGVNDGDEHADALVRRFRGIRGLFNVIPWNPVDNLPFKRPSEGRIDAFLDRLEDGGLKVSERRKRGSDIAAACGQLALRRS